MIRSALHAFAMVVGVFAFACTAGGSTDGGDVVTDQFVVDSSADVTDGSSDIGSADTGCVVSMADYCFDQTPGGGCGDIARTPNCVSGRNVCPPGTVPGTSCNTTSTNPAWCPQQGAVTGDPCMLPDGGTETDECRYPTAESGCPSHLRGCRCVSMQFMCSCVF